MTAVSAGWDRSRLPSLAAAAALHLGLFAAVMLLGRPPMTLSSGVAVPITLVADAPHDDARAAVAAPEAQAATTPAPVERAPPPEPAPAKVSPPPPAPAPPRAVAKPRPIPKVETPTPIAKPTPAKSRAPSPAFNLDALEASIAKTAHPSKPALARQGSARAETATQARVATGQGVSQSDMQGLQQLLERLWNVNCAAEGGGTVVVPVKFTIGPDGTILGPVTGGGQERSSDPVIYAAARRAIDAAHRAEPYGEAYHNRTFKVIFDAQKACSQR